VSPGSGEVRTKGLEMSILRSSSAFYISSVQWKELDCIPPVRTQNG
jgi:hypothetical protein